ncbi:hypothetical protein ACH5RR_013270 [Cinchona calisaya]|uniref:Uncharacterized protein n=1 Tax=Cinchona calisaya TaxID=153742 RepID=A0ABD3A599_9GENT
MEGIVVGMLGSDVAGRGGSVTFGVAGRFGKDGKVLGNGGTVGFGRVGIVGIEAGNGGNVVAGIVGIAGNGCTLGIDGIVGTTVGDVCSSWRAAAKLISMLETDKIMMIKEITENLLL